MSNENNPLPKNVTTGSQSIFLHEINWSDSENLLDLGIAYYSDMPNLAGLGLRIHFNSEQAEFIFDSSEDLSSIGFDDIFQTGYLPVSKEISDDVDDYDNFPSTDKFVSI